MNVLELPFNKILLIKKSDKPDTILMLENGVKYQNHLGTIHASAQYALAEASSGEGLNEAYSPVLRRVQVKYRNLAKRRLFSEGFIDADRAMKAKKELSEKGRTLVDVIVKLVDEGKNITFESTFTWFIAKSKK